MWLWIQVQIVRLTVGGAQRHTQFTQCIIILIAPVHEYPGLHLCKAHLWVHFHSRIRQFVKRKYRPKNKKEWSPFYRLNPCKRAASAQSFIKKQVPGLQSGNFKSEHYFESRNTSILRQVSVQRARKVWSFRCRIFDTWTEAAFYIYYEYAIFNILNLNSIWIQASNVRAASAQKAWRFCSAALYVVRYIWNLSKSND